MEQGELETLIRKIDARTKRIEQILPTFVTKEDAKAFLTKDDAQQFATKDDLKPFATKDDLKAFATKNDLTAFPRREEMRVAIREEGEITRRHFDAVAERIEQNVKVIAEGHEATKARVALSKDMETTFSKHDRRIMRLEAKSMNRRRGKR